MHLAVIAQLARIPIVALQKFEESIAVLRLPGRHWRPIGFVEVVGHHAPTCLSVPITRHPSRRLRDLFDGYQRRSVAARVDVD